MKSIILLRAYCFCFKRLYIVKGHYADLVEYVVIADTCDLRRVYNFILTQSRSLTRQNSVRETAQRAIRESEFFRRY